MPLPRYLLSSRTENPPEKLRLAMTSLNYGLIKVIIIFTKVQSNYCFDENFIHFKNLVNILYICLFNSKFQSK